MQPVCDLEIECSSADDGEQREYVRLQRQLLNGENTIDNRERECKQYPDDGKPRLRRLVPCKGSKERGRSPCVQPGGGSAIRRAFLRREARDGVKSLSLIHIYPASRPSVSAIPMLSSPEQKSAAEKNGIAKQTEPECDCKKIQRRSTPGALLQQSPPRGGFLPFSNARILTHGMSNCGHPL